MLLLLLQERSEVQKSQKSHGQTNHLTQILFVSS